MSAAAIEKSRAAIDEPDRLEGFPTPREVGRVFGHGAALAQFEEALAGGRMHHAWLLVGPEGIGKATLAYHLARGVLAQSESEGAGGRLAAIGADHPVFRKVAVLSHPNLLLLRRDFNEKSKRYFQWIGVDEVRRLRAFLGNSAGERGWRVVIVDRADELNQNAANALLKTLEEPPQQTLFLLVAAAEGRLPVTIRSRVQTLRLAPLEAEDLETAVRAALDGREMDEATLRTALALSEGSVRRALELATGEGIALHGEIVALLSTLPHLDGARLHRLVERLCGPGDGESLELFVSLLLGVVERLVRASTTGEALAPDEERLAARLVGPANRARWAEAWEAIGRAKAEAFVLNLDRGLFVLETFAQLQRLVREHPVPPA